MKARYPPSIRIAHINNGLVRQYACAAFAQRSRHSVALVGQHRQRMKLDAFLVQLLGVLRRGLAVDRAVLDLAVMHLARLLGKFLPDIVGVLGQVLAQLLELLAELALLRRHHGDRCRRFGRGHGGRNLRRRGRVRRRGGHLAPLLRTRELRRHQRFLNLGGAALRTGDEAALGLLVVGRGVLEPALESVPLLAGQRIADHDGPRTACRWTGSAIGSMISNRRPCWSEGIFPRAAATSAGSIEASTTPGSVPPSARMRPQGSTTSEWPSVAG